MESEPRWKRKRAFKPNEEVGFVMSLVGLSFLIFLFVSSRRSLLQDGSFRPVLKVSTMSLLPSRLTKRSVQVKSSPLIVEDRILFGDHLLLIVSSKINTSENLDCVYYRLLNASAWQLDQVVVRPAISVDEYHEVKSIVMCPLPERSYSAALDLQRAGDATDDELLSAVNQSTAVVPSLDKVVYEAILDWNTAVLFVKGLKLPPHKESDPTQFRCHFGSSNFDEDEGTVLTTEAITAAQEVVRCLLPRSMRNNTEKAEGLLVTVSRVLAGEDSGARPLPSVARIYSTTKNNDQKITKHKYELCACTMLWNQAAFMREWITYHGWLGIQRWFIYDNNSDDGLQEVIDELNLQKHNISRHSWPWIKTQEAGLSHCGLRARNECKWLAFFDVDEFFYFPQHKAQDKSGQNSLRNLVANYTNSPTYAEIRTVSHSFGPSRLNSAPLQGVTVGYTCRLKSPERYKSIVRPDLLGISLLNEVHHFRLREGYKHLNLPKTTVVLNHYKYQVWYTYNAKFFRRASTYVEDWQEGQNKGSKGKAQGFGTVTNEPADWKKKFCQVWDTGLKDFVQANFVDPASGFLPWERSLTSLEVLTS
ncbi:hypothetical protein K2173_006436 [Erythroxylum novogranatense]|uniref:Glycosyltransferase family 92 protein n=1 Tax=Erythroxylum novogranatense TaxID=1862640 RepID=A0AAV8U3C7_9ROSI|nr:hypothetical protein K2173_006436 [Erythroxylum novogranatense]